MAFYLPERHVAFDVVDDPYSAPVEREAFPGITVIAVTSREFTNPELLASLAADARGAGGARCARPTARGGRTQDGDGVLPSVR